MGKLTKWIIIGIATAIVLLIVLDNLKLKGNSKNDEKVYPVKAANPTS